MDETKFWYKRAQARNKIQKLSKLLNWIILVFYFVNTHIYHAIQFYTTIKPNCMLTYLKQKYYHKKKLFI